MTRDDIIRMAMEASSEDGSVVRDDGKTTVLYAAKTSRFLERFSALVAAAERNAILQMSRDQWFKTQADFDEAIRARGEMK